MAAIDHLCLASVVARATNAARTATLCECVRARVRETVRTCAQACGRACVRACAPALGAAAEPGSSRNGWQHAEMDVPGHNYMGHDVAGHNYICHNDAGHDYIDHDYKTGNMQR